MISFNYLGNLGRIGNQMFQYASLRGISSNRGFDFCIPPENVFGSADVNVKNSAENIHTVFNVNQYNHSITDNKIVEESTYKFDEDLFNNCEDNIDLYGYFQTEKYFKHIEDEIRKDFSFSSEVIESCKQFLNDNIQSNNIISLHVRRGDYLNLQSFHPPLSIEYYSEALNRFPKIPVLVFSDDVNWCQSQDLFDDRFFISQTSSAEYDMCLMSLCTHHIIANSSFSWWGAWLSKSKNVIAPKIWFGESLSHHDTSDVYCEGWEVI